MYSSQIHTYRKETRDMNEILLQLYDSEKATLSDVAEISMLLEEGYELERKLAECKESLRSLLCVIAARSAC